jgi:hypothetical protein
MDLAPAPNKGGIADTMGFYEAELGFVEKSRQIKDLARIQAPT